MLVKEISEPGVHYLKWVRNLDDESLQELLAAVGEFGSRATLVAVVTGAWPKPLFARPIRTDIHRAALRGYMEIWLSRGHSCEWLSLIHI